VNESKKILRHENRAPRVRPGGDFAAKAAVCPFCDRKVKIDYKDLLLLSRYISTRGKIESRQRTKACAKHQRSLAQAMKRARFLALLPYASSHIWKTGGVGLPQSISRRS